MNNHRRTVLAYSLSATAASLLAACGSGDSATVASPTSASGCTASANAKVGKSTTLSTRSHLVSGQAKIIDSCTIEIANFTYDGGGLSKVFVYGGIGGNYIAGFPIGPNLKGTVYTGQTLRLTLNAGDIDKLDGISIWCADVNANFGDGSF